MIKKFQGLLYKIDNLKNKKIRNKVAIINIESISKKNYFNKTMNFAIQSLKNKQAEGFINLPINKKILPKKICWFHRIFLIKIEYIR